MRPEPCEEAFEIASGEFPLEWARCRGVVLFESQEPLLHLREGAEVIGSEHLALDDREIDFDLIKPTGVDGSVDEDRVGPFGAEAVDSFLATMSGAVAIIQKTWRADL